MPQIGQTLQLKINTDRTYTFTMYTQAGTIFTDFTSAATVTGKVWRGDDQTASLTLTGSATNASTGKVTVTITAANTASMAEGLYRFEVIVTEGGLKRTVFDGRLELTATAGSGSAGTSYCTYEDMKLYAPWLDDVLDPSEDQTGAAEQRTKARKWLEGLGHAHYRGSLGDVTGGYWTLQNLWGRTRRSGRDSQLQTWFDENRLILNPDVVEACAKQAIYYLLLAKLTPGTVGKGTGYGQLAARFASEAKTLVSTMTLEIDTTTTADNTPDLYIDLSATDTLYG